MLEKFKFYKKNSKWQEEDKKKWTALCASAENYFKMISRGFSPFEKLVFKESEN